MTKPMHTETKARSPHSATAPYRFSVSLPIAGSIRRFQEL
jgi:hypothetical protein